MQHLYQLNLISFTIESLKPSNTTVIEKLNDAISFYASKHRPAHNGAQNQHMNPGHGYNPYQHHYGQWQGLQPHMSMYSGGPFNAEPEVTLITIKKDKITFKFGGTEHYFVKASGAWLYTIQKSHYNEPLSYYSGMLCDEIIAACK